MQKLIQSNDEEMLKSCNYLKEFHFNKLTRPFTIVSREEFEDYEDTWYPEFIGIGQIMSESEKEDLLGAGTNASTIHMHYRFYDTRGYARCKFRKEVPPVNKWERSRYVDDVLYIRFGCDHNGAKLVDSDPFERTYRCEKCGLTWSEQTGY